MHIANHKNIKANNSILSGISGVRKVSFSAIFMTDNLEVTENCVNTTQEQAYNNARARVIYLRNRELQYISVKRIHPLFAVFLYLYTTYSVLDFQNHQNSINNLLILKLKTT